MQAFLESKDVKVALNQSQSALAALTVLKKVCDHPALLSKRAATTIARKGACSCRPCGCTILPGFVWPRIVIVMYA